MTLYEKNVPALRNRRSPSRRLSPLKHRPSFMSKMEQTVEKLNHDPVKEEDVEHSEFDDEINKERHEF